MKNILIAFHIGRGGRFNNSGHKTFIGQDKSINWYASDCNDIYINPENEREILNVIKGKENLTDLYYNDKVLFEKRTRIKVGPDYYYKYNTPLDLPVDNDGTGCIDMDGEYNTTIVMFLKNCDEREIELIYNSNLYKSNELQKYCKAYLIERNLIFED